MKLHIVSDLHPVFVSVDYTATDSDSVFIIIVVDQNQRRWVVHSGEHTEQSHLMRNQPNRDNVARIGLE